MAISNSGRSSSGIGGFSSVGEITVKANDLRSFSKQMHKCASNLRSRSLSPTFSYSTGQTVQELAEFAVQLKTYGDNVAALIDKLATTLAGAADTFETTDNMIAGQMLKENGK